MHLLPREENKLLLSAVGNLAQRRLARGLRLNLSEATGLIASVLQELIRDGNHSVAELMALGESVCSTDMVDRLLHRVRYEESLSLAYSEHSNDCDIQTLITVSSYRKEVVGSSARPAIGSGTTRRDPGRRSLPGWSISRHRPRSNRLRLWRPLPRPLRIISADSRPVVVRNGNGRRSCREGGFARSDCCQRRAYQTQCWTSEG